MEFGILKSKIEKKLTESYSKNRLNSEMKNFKKFVLENPEVNKVFHIYNELSKGKNYEKIFAENFVNECVDLYSKIKIDTQSLELLEKWVGNVETENNYKDIDLILNKKILNIENIVNSKRRIVENLTKKEDQKSSVNLPLEKIYEVAQENLKKYLSELNESELKEIKKYLNLSESEIQKRYEVLSEMTIEKLEKLLTESDKETSQRIQETIDKIKTEEINSVNFIKLKTLNENL